MPCVFDRVSDVGEIVVSASFVVGIVDGDEEVEDDEGEVPSVGARGSVILEIECWR